MPGAPSSRECPESTAYSYERAVLGVEGSGGAGDDEVAEVGQGLLRRLLLIVRLRQGREHGAGRLGPAAEILAGLLHRRVLAQQLQRLGVQGVVGERTGEQLAQAGALR